MQTLSTGNDFILALLSRISSDELDGEMCYVIKWSGETTYISKENGIILKRAGGKVVKNGIETESIVEYKDWKFNELTDEEMDKPDLTGYEVSGSVSGYDYQY